MVSLINLSARLHPFVPTPRSEPTFAGRNPLPPQQPQPQAVAVAGALRFHSQAAAAVQWFLLPAATISSSSSSKKSCSLG